MSWDRAVKAGITRFSIITEGTGRGVSRIEDSKRYWAIANALYRDIFRELGMPLLPTDETISCTKESFQAGYDYQLGVDVILRPQALGESTMQEKFLFTDFNTVTVEHCQDWLTLEPGDWFNLKAQYYFVGYDPDKRNGQLAPWVLLDWAQLQRATAQGRVPWRLRGNHRENVGARASFLYVDIDKVPLDIIVMSSKQSA